MAGDLLGPCRLYVDHAPWDAPEVGDAYVSSTGQAYLILDARPVQRGPNAGTRTRMLCERMPEVELPEGTVVREFQWHRRSRR